MQRPRILNEDGLLPCPFCGEYPTPKEELDENDVRIYAIEHECNIDMTTGWESRQADSDRRLEQEGMMQTTIPMPELKHKTEAVYYWLGQGATRSHLHRT